MLQFATLEYQIYSGQMGHVGPARHYNTIFIIIINIMYQGHLEDLIEMNDGRVFHACGSYYSDGLMVSVVVVLV